jgi:23S rRNA (uracil747-C5)-methyltransferase
MVVTGTTEAPIIGLTGEDVLDQGRELESCPIHNPKINEVLRALPEWIRQYSLTPYRIEKRQGELKGLIAFYSPKTREMYLRFILRSQECVSRLRKMLPDLQRKFPELVCVTANIQPIPHAILEGPLEIFLTERTRIIHQMGDVRLPLAPQAFVQTNAEVATILYQTAARWIAEVQPARALELYCGQGAFSFFAEKSAGSWLGIELNPDAVFQANTSAREQGLAHLQFKCSDATRVDDELRAFAPELVLVNPPRRGLGEGVRVIQEYLPKHLIYSSCQVETLSEDLKKLASLYTVRKGRIFDLFPHTSHLVEREEEVNARNLSPVNLQCCNLTRVQIG